ncbi:hypothetical protein SH2C18_37730 [Clostridium sediminicola]|uniref:DUF4339 domain-containing protein n=1 Tax=Clostridium sediminicola TaxID=3114879 RepID=UPI0031F1D0AC
MIEKKWFYYLNEHKYGPLSENELKEKFKMKELEHITLIWKDGMTSWLPAHKVDIFLECLNLPEEFKLKKAKLSIQKLFFVILTLACVSILAFLAISKF